MTNRDYESFNRARKKLSTEVLSQIQNQAVQNIVREIIFSNAVIKWDKVDNIISKHMPELTVK